MNSDKIKKHLSVPAYRERCQNFYLLRNGLMRKYVDNALDLEDRQQQSLFKLTDGKSDDFTYNSGYFHACTAFGKSYLIKAMAEGYAAEEKNRKIVILEENINVLKQIKKDLLVNSSFKDADIGTYFQDEKNTDAPILIATYASMGKLLKDIKKEDIGLVLCDEAHHILSQRRQEVAKQFDYAALYGFTATPHYNTDKECAQVFGNIIDSVTIRKGVESNLLCSFKNGLFVSHIPLDITEAKTASGEYDPTKLAQILRDSHLHGMREELADFYLQSSDKELGRLYGKTTLINVPSQEEADILAETFNQKAGKTIAKSYHTNTDEAPLAEFNNGEFPVLIQVNKLSEGYNNKKVEICINYPTGSKVRSAQRSGRALRRDDAHPDKLALIVDVAFKRRQSGDILQEIHDNGQVLFMDVAEEGAIYSEAYRHAHPEIDLVPSQVPSVEDNNDDKKRDEPQFLFDIMTDYRDIYKLIYNHLELQEMRIKQPYDLIKNEFVQRYNIFKNGEMLSYPQREQLFDELVQNPEFIRRHIMKRALCRSRKTCWTFDSRRVRDLEKELNLGFVYRNVKELPFRLETDIMKEDLVKYFNVVDNGKEIPQKQNREFFDRLCENEDLLERNLIHPIRSGTKNAYAIDGTRLDEFLVVSGVKIERKSVIAPKAENDIGQEDFCRYYNVTENGKTLMKDEKRARFNQMIRNEELIRNGIIKNVTISHVPCYVIDNTKLDMLYRLTGIELEEKIKSRPREPEDITRAEFIRADYTVTQDGKQLVYKDKVLLIAKLFANQDLQKRGIIVPVKDDGKFIYVINGRKSAELFALTGIKIEKRDYLEEKQKTDINLTLFRTDYCVFINGKELNFDEKSEFFNQFCRNKDYLKDGYIKTVQSRGHSVSVIDGTKLDEIKTHLGFEIKEKAIYNEPSEFDINMETFSRNYVVTINNEKVINRELRAELFRQLIKDEKLLKAGIIKNVSPGTFVIDSSRLDEISQLTNIAVFKRVKLQTKDASDISKTDFIDNFVAKKDGKTLDLEQRKEFFNRLLEQKDEADSVIKMVQTKTTICYVIDGQKLEELSKLTGVHIERKISDTERKKNTDIIRTDFVKKYHVTANGKVLYKKQKLSCFNTLVQNKELISSGIVKKIHSGPFTTFAIDRLQLDKLFELTGIKPVPLAEVENRKENDISGNDFIRMYDAVENGQTLSVKERIKLFNSLIKDEELKEAGIVKNLPTVNYDVIDGDRLAELKRLKGIAIAKRTAYPEKQDSDITITDLVRYFKVTQNGAFVPRDDKKELFDKLCTDTRLLNLNLVRMVHSSYTTVMMIDGTRLGELEKLTGISIRKSDDLPQRKATDIVQSAFVKKYSATQHGKKLSKTDRLEVFLKLVEDEELLQKGIVKKVKSRQYELKVIDGTKLNELQEMTGVRVMTPQQKVFVLQEKLEHAQTEEEKQKYQEQLQSMFKFIKRQHIHISPNDKQND